MIICVYIYIYIYIYIYTYKYIYIYITIHRKTVVVVAAKVLLPAVEQCLASPACSGHTKDMQVCSAMKRMMSCATADALQQRISFYLFMPSMLICDSMKLSTKYREYRSVTMAIATVTNA